MKSRFLPCLFLLFAFFPLQNTTAQTNVSVEIVGPSIMCFGNCDTFFVVVNNGQPQVQYTVQWSINSTPVVADFDKLLWCPQDPGTYLLMATVSNGINGGFLVDTFFVTVLPYQPLTILSSNTAPCNFDSLQTGNNNTCEKVCPNTTVTYSVTTTSTPGGSQTGLNWQVSGASSYTVNPPFNNSVTVTWGPTGVGSVVVISDGTAGCAGEDALCVTIIAEPVAQFAADPAPTGNTVQVCKGQTVYFDNQSTGADNYEWFFSDDLSSSVEVDPQHVFLTPGNYTVRLIARSDCLCADTAFLNVEVLDATAPTLDCVGTICPGETVTYTASNACAPYSWAVTPNGTVVSGGTASVDSITVQWNAGPDGVITLGAQPCSGNACPNPANIHIPVISDDADIRGEDQVCPAAVEVYTIEPYGGTDFVWSLSGGGTITEGQGTNRITVAWTDIPNVNTTYWLTVTYNNCYLGCGGQDSLGVKVLSPFILNGPVELCEGASGSFAAKLSYNFLNIACNWTLLAPDGSSSWTSAAPAASVSVPFLSGPGIYRLLAVPDNLALSCSVQADWVINVAALPATPTGILGEKNICPGTTYTYEAAGVLASNNLRWTVKNGAAAPTVSFGDKINVTWGNANPRWISVAQVSTNGLNCTSDTALLSVQGIGLIFLDGSQVVCEDATASYSMIALQNVDIQWHISPATAGTVASGQGTNAVEIFWTEPGGHTVSVNVCSQSSFTPVTVIAPPQPVVQYTADICPGQTSPVQTATPYSVYSWRDAAGNELANTPATNLDPGSYSVYVEDPNGCPGVEEFTVNQKSAPNVSITTADPTGFCNNSLFITLTALANADGNFTYQWYQDGAPVGGNSPNYITNQYGNFTVEVTNAAGCSATAGPILTFNYCGGGGGGGGLPGTGFPFCPAGSVDFTATATALCDSFDFQLIPGPQYVPGSAEWTFGVSGSGVVGTALVENPGFNFPNAGKYLAILKVTLTDGSMCVVLDSVKVQAAAQFSATAACTGAATTFEDASTFLPGSGITDWNWVFGDPPSGASNISDIRNPAHTYSTAGNPLVSLTVTANSGCTATASQALAIPASSPANFTPPVQNCAGNALEFIAVLTPDITQVVWNFGDLSSGASNDATGSPAYHNFTAPGNYAVNTTASNAYGCTATVTQIISISSNGLSGNISPASPAPICEGASITLTAPAGAVSYLWSDSTTTTQTFVATEEGSYSVTLTDANGCTYAPPPVNVEITPGPDALIKALLENALGQIIGTSYPTLTTCEGEDVHLLAQGNGAYNYAWSGGNGFDNEVFFTDDRNNLLSVGTHTFTVTVTDIASGCTSVADPFLVTVNPNPSGFSIASSGSCAGSANVLTYSGPQPANWQFIWNNGAPGPSLTTDASGLYYIRVINEFGCEAKSNSVVILPGPNVAAIPGGCHSRCRPDTLCLPNIPNIVGWQWYFNGSPVPGANSPDFVATQSGAYYAELTDQFGCTNQSDPLTLNLFDGFGNIDGQVWADVNGSGAIDAGDTLVSGIDVNLLESGAQVGAGVSAANGGFAFTNIPSTGYVVEIDPDSLASIWKIVIGQNPVALSGCDALAESDLLIKYCPPTGSLLQVNVCPNEVYDYNGTLLQAGETQDFILTNFQGCDSIVTVSVFGVNATASSFAVSICPNDTYDYNGTPLPPGTTQDFHFQNQLGCDSTVTVTVNALQASASVLDVAVCPGDLYDYNGTLLSAGQTQNFVYTNAAGCDSTVTVTVAALPVSISGLSVSVCPGELYDYNGTMLATGQIQNFVFTNAAGCDSTVTVTVNQLPVDYMVVDALACEGDSLLFDGVWIPVNSVHIFTYQNAAGCDSIIEVAVGSFGPIQTSTLSAVVCPGETFAYNGQQLQPGTTTDVALANIWGCDSIVSVTVTALTVSNEVLEVEVCPGLTYTYAGVELAAGATRDFHFTTPEGCDSTVMVTVTALPEAAFSVQPETSCATSPTGSLTVTAASGGLPPYRYSIDGTAYQDSLRFSPLAAGDYTVYLEDSNGCVFDENVEITALPRLEVGLTDGVLPCDNTGTRLEVGTNDFFKNLSFSWFNGDTTFFTFVTDAGPVWVDVTNHCETVRGEASVNWEDIPSGSNYVYVPNVIKPASNEPDNSEFKPFFQPNLTILDYRFEVFDRWGNKMFSTGQTDAGWSGSFRADDMNPGVYVWYVKVRFAFCGIEKDLLLTGDVTVVR